MEKLTYRIIFIIGAIIIGLSNCSMNIFTAMVSACVGYAFADFSYFINKKFY